MKLEANDGPLRCAFSLASSGFGFEGQVKEASLTGGVSLNRSDDKGEKWMDVLGFVHPNTRRVCK